MHRQAVELAAQAYGKVTDIDHLLHFPPALLQALAHLVANQSTQSVLMATQRLAVLPHDLAALRSGYHAPVRKGLGCRLYDLLVLFGSGDTDPTDHLPVDGRGAAEVVRTGP